MIMLTKKSLHKILRNKYGNYLKRKEIAKELGIAYSTLEGYSKLNNLRTESKLYPLDKFIDFIYEHQTSITMKTITKRQRYYQILYFLYTKFKRIMLSKQDFLKLINFKIKSARLDNRIKAKKDLPSFYKYHSFRFNIAEIAKYLTSQQWFNVPIAKEKATVYQDTIRLMVRNIDYKNILEYYQNNGYSYKEYKYHYDFFYTNQQKGKPIMFRLTKLSLKDSLPGVSLEFFGLKTYNDLLDVQRKNSLDLFFIFVNKYNLQNQTIITKIDMAFDFKLSLSDIKIYHSRKDIDEKYTYYQLSLDDLYTIPEEVLTQAKIQKTTSNTSKNWIDNSYDILITSKHVKITYEFMKNNQKVNFLKLKRLNTKIYDKAKKANLSSQLTRIEFTFEQQISFKDFCDKKKVQKHCIHKLQEYYIFISNKFYKLEDI